MFVYTAHEEAVIGMIALTPTCSIIFYENVIFLYAYFSRSATRA